MADPYDNDDFNDYRYGLSEAQIRERMRYAIEGDPDEDEDAYFDSLGDASDDDEYDDDE
jgi:hypothetical protein